jgi:serine/threonine protein kinase
MAEVRAAQDTRLDRPVAIKTLLPESAADPECRRRFRTEAAVGAGLSHPNIIAVLDAGEEDGVPFIVMERVPGTSLKDTITSGPLEPDLVEGLGADVLSGLTKAHEAGVIHRDLKPSNILASGDGHWKVADFGIVRWTRPESADLTVTGMVVGTPAYIAPERFLGQPATPASDIYSLGVVLYEALAGRRPYDVQDTYPRTVALSGSAPTPVGTLRPDAPPTLAAAIDRSVSLDPANRFATASDMAAALTPKVGLESTRVMRIPLVTPGGRRLRPAIVAVGTAVVAASLALAIIGAQGGRPSPAVPTTRQTVPPSTMPAPTTTPQTTPTTLAQAAHAPPPHARGGPKHEDQG